MKNGFMLQMINPSAKLHGSFLSAYNCDTHRVIREECTGFNARKNSLTTYNEYLETTDFKPKCFCPAKDGMEYAKSAGDVFLPDIDESHSTCTGFTDEQWREMRKNDPNSALFW